MQNGEKVMAAAEAEHIADVREELRQYTLVVTPIIEKVSDKKIIISFIRNVQTVEELARITKIWEEDTPISAQVDQRDK